MKHFDGLSIRLGCRFLLIFLFGFSVNLMAQGETLRNPPAGKVTGLIDESGATSWRGIPYARPPVADLRWKAPRAVEAWSGIFEASAFGNICYQLGSPMLGVDPSLYGKPVGSEDCLNLNIWAPAGAVGSAPAVPVMVWIHGGSNVGGSGRFYNGGNLAQQQDVVVVTINYRLGLFGWFSHPALRNAAQSDLDRSANFGTLDIIQALKWIQRNISSFGGDPGNVTVFGESAGAMNILSLLYSPPAKGLFHKAIMQSGSVRQTPVKVAEERTKDDRSEFSSAESAAKILVQRGDVPDLDSARAYLAGLTERDFRKLMREATGEELINTYATDIALRIRAPQVIPDGLVIPHESPWRMLNDADKIQRVPLMLGTNRDEMKFFLGLDPNYVKIIPGEAIVIHDPQIYNLHATYLSDRWTALGVDEIASRMVSHNPAIYAYRFDWDEQPSYPSADFKDFFGAAHTMELPFVFNDFSGYPLFSLHFTEQNREGREKLAAQMGEYWANFAYTGKPGQGRSGRLPPWPSWAAGNKQILDAEDDQGVQTRKQLLTMQSLRNRFHADSSFRSQEDKARFQKILFESREAWVEEFQP